MNLDKAGVVLRPALEGDISFIRSSWQNSYEKTFLTGLNGWPGKTAGPARTILRSRERELRITGSSEKSDRVMIQLYRTEWNRLMTQIIAKAELRVLYPREDVNAILAWSASVYGRTVYIYTKQNYRHMGLGTHLLGLDEGCENWFMTAAGKVLVRQRGQLGAGRATAA